MAGSVAGVQRHDVAPRNLRAGCGGTGAEAEMRRSWQLTDVDYYYDLELDAAGRIIGGEWYTPEHPDFLWTPPVGARAVSRYEGMATGAWDTAQVLPVSWREAAVRAARDGVPLAGMWSG